jgi:hypothetical protein
MRILVITGCTVYCWGPGYNWRVQVLVMLHVKTGDAGYHEDALEGFECLGEEDPTQEMYLNLLVVWREGEKAGFVSRKVCYTVVGICDTGRPSTLSVFKPGTPYYYGLFNVNQSTTLKMHIKHFSYLQWLVMNLIKLTALIM